MNVYICEKPSLARALAKGLGSDLSESAMKRSQQSEGFISIGNHRVTHCFGHMLELLDPEEHDIKYKEWSLDLLPMRFTPKLKVKKEAKKQYSVISRLVKEATTLYNVGDPDEEGQLLVDEILTFEGVMTNDGRTNKPVKRILIADLNAAAVKKSLNNIVDNSKHVRSGHVALSRSISDQLFGYNLSRAYTLAARKKGYDGTINIGRVQTAIVNMIYERCQQVKTHKESFYYRLVGQFTFGGVVFPAAYQTLDTDPVNEKGQLVDQSFTEALSQRIEGQTAVIASAIHKPVYKAAPMPYTLATLQSDCARKFGISAQQTLDTAQALYEKHTLITYPRSNCKYLGDDHFDERLDVLSAIGKTSGAFVPFIDGAKASKPHKCFNSAKVGAHHGIIPTTNTANFSALSDIEQKVYNLIARSYIGVLYPTAIYDKSDVTVKVAELQFSVSSEVLKSQGWKVLYQNDQDNPDIEENAEITTPLSSLAQGQQGNCSSASVEKKKGQKPKYYVESSLLRDLTHVAKHITDPVLKSVMEKKFKALNLAAELGTEATRASILEKVFESGMAEKVEMTGYKERAYITTALAEKVLPILPDGCKKVDVTAKWVDMGNDIIEGTRSVTDYVDEVYQFLSTEINHVKANGLNVKFDTTPCPKCNEGHLRLIKSGSSPFFGCSNHPDCDAVFNEYKGKPFTQSHTCPVCQSPLVLRNTKGEYWFGCSGFNNGCKESFGCQNGKPVKRTAQRRGTKKPTPKGLVRPQLKKK